MAGCVGLVIIYVRVGKVDGPGPRPGKSMLRIALYVLGASLIANEYSR